MDILNYMALGLETSLIPANLFYCFAGVFLGTFIGVLPGIGPLAAMSMLFPITFYLDPTSAIIMLAGIWYGNAYGGGITAILLNIPGAPASAVTCLDGNPMARSGRAGVALFTSAFASFCGGCLGILLLMLLAPVIVKYALQFGAAEYFALMVLGLVAASTITSGSAIKALAMVVFGLALGTVDTDIYTGVSRFSFGILDLIDGLSLAALAMGVFGVAEVIGSLLEKEPATLVTRKVSLRSMLPRLDDFKRMVTPILRGSGLGGFFGTLPGSGPAISAFVSYAIEKRVARDPSRFGKGAIEGIASPEAANNAADQTAFIPTLTLGIPGSPTMALMLGALLIHGITPGPRLMVEQPSLFWGVVMSFWVGNIMLLVLNIPLIGLWVRLLTVPQHILYPTVLMFICIGTYSVNFSAFEVGLVAGFGLLGYIMRIFDFPAAPLLLGFVLGPMVEENFRRAMLLSRGDFGTFIHRPISAVILVITLALLAWGIYSSIRMGRRPGAEDDMAAATN